MNEPINEKRAQALAGGSSLSHNLENALCISDGNSYNSTYHKAFQEIDYEYKSQCDHDKTVIASSLLVNTYEYNFRNSTEKRFDLLYGIQKLKGMSKFQVRNCMSFMPKKGDPLQVDLVKKHDGRLAMNNLKYCSSVWLCPVCSSRIAAERRKELAQAVESSDAYTVLITYTLQHDRSDKLEDLLNALRRAVNKVKSGRWYEAYLQEHEIIASASSLEFTHGSHGWHPHYHQLLFLRKKPNPDRIHDQLSERFTHFLMKDGQYASSFHGIDVRSSRKDVSGYISKWNVIDELINVQYKKGRSESLNVWQLAQLAVSGDPEASRLWLEYAKASYRKKALQWSRGARELLGIGQEETDEEIAQEDPMDEGELICSFTMREFHYLRDYGFIGEIFFLARIGGAKAINEFMLRVRGAPLELLIPSHNCT